MMKKQTLADPCSPFRATICGLFVAASSLTTGCATGPQAAPQGATAAAFTQTSPQDIEAALDAYIAIDQRQLIALSDDNVLAARLLSILDREEQAPDNLLEIVRTLPAGDTRDRLFFIAIDHMIAAHRWSDVLRWAEDFQQNEGLANYVRPYTGWPDASVEYAGRNVTEVPFDGLHIPARLNGREIEIALDTGAPGVGVHHDFIDLVEVDRANPQNYALPAFDLVVSRNHALVDRLTIGDFTLLNVAATVGQPPAGQDVAKFERMEAITGRHDIIMGLDALRPFFDVIEFDYNRNVVRLIRDDTRHASAANMIMGDGRKPVIRLRTQNRIGSYYVDTGSYGHLLGEGAFDTPQCAAQRTMAAPWRDIVETRVSVAFGDAEPVEAWAQPSSLVTEPEWDLFGYIGNPRRGVYRLDLRDGHFALEDYDSSALDSLWPITDQREGTCPPAPPISE